MIVIAIDDSPERYVELAKVLRDQYNLTLVCMQHPTSIKMALNPRRVIAVLLDFDMPILDDNDELFKGWNGLYIAQEVLPAWLPLVIISSANPDGAQKIKASLDEQEIKNIVISVTDPNHYNKWLEAIVDAQPWPRWIKYQPPCPCTGSPR
jgi:hypothetical protein